MAFICPPKDETAGKTKLLNDLKNVVQELQNQVTVDVNPICVPCCVPVVCLPKGDHGESAHTEESKKAAFKPPKVMVCYKVCDKMKNKNTKKAGDNANAHEVVHRVKHSISRELRASIMYIGCDCEKTNGLQDDCLRTDCRGSPDCLTKPPTCGPSEFCNGKHLTNKLTRKNNSKNNQNHFKSTSDPNHVHNDGLANLKYECYPAVVKSPIIACSCEPAKTS